MTARVRLAAAAILVAATVLAFAHVPTACAAPTGIRAPAAILVEPSTGDVVYQRNAAEPRPIASTTKLMTVLLTLERTKPSDTMAAVRYHALPAESVIGLRAGERLTREQRERYENAEGVDVKLEGDTATARLRIGDCTLRGPLQLTRDDDGDWRIAGFDPGYGAPKSRCL